MISKLLLSLLFISSIILGQSNDLNIIPTRIILNITDKPATSFAVTWRTKEKTNKPEIQFARATDWKEFEDSLIIAEVKIEKFVSDKFEKFYCYSGFMKELVANTEYVYRVGGDSIWSEWNQFKTGKGEKEPFKFIYFGDPQNENKNYVSRLFRKAFSTEPDADFWLFAGDLISLPYDNQYEEFFFAGSFMFRSIPMVMAPGNHDRAFLKKDGKFVLNKKGAKIRTNKIANIWKTSFTLPENGLPGFEETSYYFDYQGAKFIVINSNNPEKLQEQADWMDNILENNSTKWVIVCFHHPIYSAGRDRNDYKTREAFMPVFDKHGVDLVLTGHDHAYARSFKIKKGLRVKNNEKGTVYVVSVSGPKMYSVNERTDSLMAKVGGNTQLFQIIEIENNQLVYNSYTVTGKLFDSFILDKNIKE